MSETLPNPHLTDSEKEKLIKIAEKQARENAPNEEDSGNVQEKKIKAWVTAISVQDTLRAMADLSWDELSPYSQQQLIDFLEDSEIRQRESQHGGVRKKKKSRRRKKPRRRVTKKRRKVTKKCCKKRSKKRSKRKTRRR